MPVNPDSAGRFISIEQLAIELNVATSQAYALLRTGTLPGLKIGGRGVWRVERIQLQEWIEKTYTETKNYIEEHPILGGNIWRAGVDSRITGAESDVLPRPSRSGHPARVCRYHHDPSHA